jgi:hypothetical protein
MRSPCASFRRAALGLGSCGRALVWLGRAGRARRIVHGMAARSRSARSPLATPTQPPAAVALGRAVAPAAARPAILRARPARTRPPSAWTARASTPAKRASRAATPTRAIARSTSRARRTAAHAAMAASSSAARSTARSPCNDPVEIVGGAATTPACAKPSGSVFCWGRNQAAQIGAGTNTNTEDLPQKVALGQGVRAVALAAGLDQSCIIDHQSKLWCWGRGLEAPSKLPREIPNSSGVTAVSVWGQNGAFLLGGGAFVFEVGFLDGAVTGPSSLFAVGAGGIARGGDHGCAIRSGGAVHCWGRNDYGQLGLPASTEVLPAPTAAIPGLTATVVATGSDHSCAIAQGGQLYCWGRAIDFAQVGNDTFANVFGPQPVLADVQRVKLGTHSSGALRNGALYLWGRNDARQVSSSTDTAISIPTPRGDVPNVVDFALGAQHTCVLDAAAQVRCYGANEFGQLGVGSTDPRVGPQLVTIPRD